MNKYIEDSVAEEYSFNQKAVSGKTGKKVSKNVLNYYKPEYTHGQIIGKIASSFYYVYNDVTISELADALLKKEEILAVAVLSRSEHVVGIVSRRDLFDKVGKQFGRDLYKNKLLHELVTETRGYNYNKNIFSVADDLADHIDNRSDKFFLLFDDNKRFSGIFSGKDLLIYLSQITHKDIMLAKMLQSCIVKEEVSYINEWCSIIGATRMAKGVGGDYYYINNYTDAKWIFAVCDVAGKGISASLLSAILGGMSSIYDFNKGIPDYLCYTNSYIFNSFKTEKFVTGLFVDFDQETGKVIAYDAGHSYMFIYRNNKILRLNSAARTVPIGIQDSIEPNEISFHLLEGDIVILMSDGLEDQENVIGEKYGISRVFQLIRQNNNEPVKVIKDIILDDLKKFREQQTQTDDITLILFKYK